MSFHQNGLQGIFQAMLGRVNPYQSERDRLLGTNQTQMPPLAPNVAGTRMKVPMPAMPQITPITPGAMPIVRLFDGQRVKIGNTEFRFRRGQDRKFYFEDMRGWLYPLSDLPLYRNERPLKMNDNGQLYVPGAGGVQPVASAQRPATRPSGGPAYARPTRPGSTQVQRVTRQGPSALPQGVTGAGGRAPAGTRTRRNFDR